MATKTPKEYKAAHASGYTCQKLGFDKRRPFTMGLQSQQSAESPFKAKFEPHMMYKGSDEVMAKTYEKHLELKNKGYGHTKPKSPAKMKDVKLKGKKLPKGYTKKDKKFLKEQNEDVVRYEDLDEKMTEKIIDQILSDIKPKPGSYRGRINTEPENNRQTLMDLKNA